MGKCPKCKSQIHSLDLYEQAERRSVFFVNKKGSVETKFRKYQDCKDGQADFTCPVCWEIVAFDAKTAEKILTEEPKQNHEALFSAALELLAAQTEEEHGAQNDQGEE